MTKLSRQQRRVLAAIAVNGWWRGPRAFVEWTGEQWSPSSYASLSRSLRRLFQRDLVVRRDGKIKLTADGQEIAAEDMIAGRVSFT